MIKLVDKHYKCACAKRIEEYQIDTDADLKSLPIAPPGSYAISAESGIKFYANCSGQWPTDPGKYLPIDGLDSYIHDGATLFLDGIWNSAENVHSDTLTAWVDLSGNCQPTPLGAGNTVEEKCVKSNGTNDGRMTVPDVAPVELPQFTIELVFCKNTDNINNQVIVGRDYTKSYYVNTSKGSLSCWVGKSSNTIGNRMLKTGGIYSIQLTHTGSALNLFFNGEKIISDKTSTVIADTTKLNLFGYVGNGTTFEGSLFAVRIHGRALTDEEVKHNYEIDKRRFGITDTTSEEMIQVMEE